MRLREYGSIDIEDVDGERAVMEIGDVVIVVEDSSAERGVIVTGRTTEARVRVDD